MKYSYLYFFIPIIAWGCNNSETKSRLNSDTTSHQTTSKISNTMVTHTMVLKPEILQDSVVIFRSKLSDTLFMDFNCDDRIDEAFFRKSEKEIILIIKDAKTLKENIIGADSTFQSTGNNFDWVYMWAPTADTSTYQVLTKAGKVCRGKRVKLECFSIVMRSKKGRGGIITFKNGVYVWINQAN